ncbi:hypothetical protein [Paenibacillus luteus]|uniref:hypothetical protein n=1 Tax=Paenibacillus luteus TaxID=2545753 RepID=UPI001141B458|nr:hypothetical protein [Paenibacillus luteus]
MTTIFGGLILFIISQLSLKVIIEPIVELKKIIGKVARTLLLYSNQYHNPVELTEENLNNDRLTSERQRTSLEIRTMAGELLGAVQVIPAYQIFSFLGLVPSLKRIKEARASLVGLSNSLWKTKSNDNVYVHIIETEKELIKSLRIKAFR